MSYFHVGYVVTVNGEILVQGPHDGQAGFALYSDDQTWPGGVGAASDWTAISQCDARITQDDRDRLGWVLSDLLDSHLGVGHVNNYVLTHDQAAKLRASRAECERIVAMSPDERKAYEADWVAAYAADLFKPTN
jgi:hypothetical protein